MHPSLGPAGLHSSPSLRIKSGCHGSEFAAARAGAG